MQAIVGVTMQRPRKCICVGQTACVPPLQLPLPLHEAWHENVSQASQIFFPKFLSLLDAAPLRGFFCSSLFKNRVKGLEAWR